MYTSLKDIHNGFFNLFRPTVDLAGKCIPVLYPRHSDREYYNKHREIYPQITVLDRTVKLSPDWNPNFREQIIGYEDSNDSGEFDKAEIASEPIRIEIDYQVSAYFDDVIDKWTYQEWFISKFKKAGGLLLDAVRVDQFLDSAEYVGEPIDYTMEFSENERLDGIFELNASFIVRPFVQFNESELAPLITNFNLKI